MNKEYLESISFVGDSLIMRDGGHEVICK